jgi:hypothetical protein
MAEEVKELNLKILFQIKRLSKAYADIYAEACTICLYLNNLKKDVVLLVDNKITDNVKQKFHITELSEVNEAVLASWGDLDVAVEMGAYGLALLLIHELTDLTMVERARKSVKQEDTGFDYWLGDKNDPLFQISGRLEVSGIFKGKPSQVNSRVKVKLGQVTRSDNLGHPAYIIVVEFSTPRAQVVRK